MSKKLVGGDYLLDLSSIEIEQSEDGETYTNITDANVLEQLTNLKKYVSNPQMAKPVWVKLKNGENDELVVARGTFANVDTGEFEICVQLNGYKLIISIEFTQVLNDDSQPLDDWYIAENDAKYLFTSDAQNIGAIIGTGEIDNAKPLYWHTIQLSRIGQENLSSYLIFLEIINNDDTPINMNALQTIIQTEGFIAIPHNSRLTLVSSGDKLTFDIFSVKYKDGSNFYVSYYDSDGSLVFDYTLGFGNATCTDLGVNKLN